MPREVLKEILFGTKLYAKFLSRFTLHWFKLIQV
jgi:hypothetical protein